jgi:type I restriction enzyme S subunit
MSDWHTEPLDECLEALLDYRGKSPPKSGKGVPVLSAKVVKTTGLVRPIEQKIAIDYYPKWMVRGLPRVGDVVMTTEAPMGEVIQLDAETVRYALGQRIVCMRGKPQKLDNTFLRYLLISPAQQAKLSSYATGTTVLGISQKALRSVPVSYPRFDEQKRIGELLGALDDKIELNRLMNETLEAMARAIFKDWFVDFGPTRAKMEGRAPYLAPDIWSLFPDRLDDGGKPEGWAISTVGQEFRLTMGQSPPGDTYNASGNGLPFFQGRTDFGFRYPKHRIFCTAPTRRAEADDTLISVRAPVGDLNLARETCCIGRGVAAARHRLGSRSYTYYALWAIQPDLTAFEHTGTVFGAINKAQFELLKVIAPDDRLLAAFETIATPIDDRIQHNEEETSSLIATRDLLLPKLMSGEVRVRDAAKHSGKAT